MPLPVIAGLPWLAGIFSGLFGSLIAFFAQYLTKRAALTVAAVAVLVTVTGSFMAAAYALLAGFQAAAPAAIASAMGLFLPGNLSACIGAVASAHVLRWAYVWQVKVVQYRLT